ncbi:MAG: FeoC-like transcriptional regulator [Anaerolineales bacterium]
MFRQFLETIQAGEVQSVLEIARKMDISVNMVLQMAKDLANKGYLQEISADCQEPQKSCPDCAVSSNCQIIARHWFLTEKGRASVAGRQV